MSDREPLIDEVEDLPAEPIRPEDEASAARSCAVILFLTVFLLAVIAVYLIATALT